MNRVRQLCAITLLTVMLAASSALAGDLPQGVISPQSPTGNSVTGDMPQGITSAIDPVTEFKLSLLQSMYSLF